MEISNIVRQVYLRYPLFGHIIANLDFQVCDTLKNPASTNGVRLRYNPNLLATYTEEEQMFIIAHEILHVVLRHMYRNEGKDKYLLNYVEDAIINQLLIRDGFQMPEGLVYIEEALDYSVEELYLKLLPQIDAIKDWMGVNNIPLFELLGTDGILGQMLEEIYKNDLEKLMSDNADIRDEIIDEYKERLKSNASDIFGELGIALRFPNKKVGKSKPLLYWQRLLRATLISPEETTTAFYEVEKDGIIRKEEKPTLASTKSEIIIDSSASMEMSIIKAILRECKNILCHSDISVGFCDANFYG